MKKHLVGVIIPYNVDRGFLHEAEASLDNQVYDGDLIEVLKIKIKGKNNNVSQNINAGIRIAKKEGCDFIKYFAEDDLLTENCISDSVKSMIEQDVDFIHGGAINFFDDKRQTEFYWPPFKTITIEGFLKYLKTRTNPIHGLTQFWRADVFDKIGYFRVDLKCAEEHEFTLRALYNGLKMGYAPHFMGKYRWHDKQKSLGKGVDQAERQRIIKSIHLEYRNLIKTRENE